MFENIEITDFAAQGKAVSRINNIVIFIQGAVPGDIVDIQIIRKKRNYLEGIPVKYHKYSDKRIKPFCEHFSICGGCKLQHLNYHEQLKFKQQQVVTQLERIGKIALPEISPILPSDNTIYYRNKLEFTFSNRRWLKNSEMQQEAQNKKQETENTNALGFHVSQRFDKIIDIDYCYLQNDPSNEIRLAVKNYALRNHLEFFDINNHHGFLRNLIIRTSTTCEIMVIVSFFQDNISKRKGLLDYINEAFPEITSLMYAINSSGNDNLNNIPVYLYKGRDHIFEMLGNKRFKIGPKTFFQTNSEQACRLYRSIAAMASLSGTEVVYDLYTGAGSIAIFIAGKVQKVIGIEIVSDAIEDAKQNAKINNITNAHFVAGDIIKIFSDQLIQEYGKPDIIILDPPRSGLHPKLIVQLFEAKPEKIVYVSCNPATQARDINLLKLNYELIKIQLVDMFPHTYHVENIALLNRKK
ncbi:MAG: 23S rRNA (uracil(1939)-C(5))-methyltransferase RlmD [Bacteroidia bacterium]|nr:23S rRNA (uracil(1939)-C(5))-methyltransferase RlmD [Bacteroidia bacterium]